MPVFSVWRAPSTLILPLDDPFIGSLRQMFRKTFDVTGMRLGGQTIGEYYVEAAYLYRVT